MDGYIDRMEQVTETSEAHSVSLVHCCWCLSIGKGPWKLSAGQWAALPDAAARPGVGGWQTREGAAGSEVRHWEAASGAWDASQHEDAPGAGNSHLPPPTRTGRAQVPESTSLMAQGGMGPHSQSRCWCHQRNQIQNKAHRHHSRSLSSYGKVGLAHPPGSVKNYVQPAQTSTFIARVGCYNSCSLRWFFLAFPRSPLFLSFRTSLHFIDHSQRSLVTHNLALSSHPHPTVNTKMILQLGGGTQLTERLAQDAWNPEFSPASHNPGLLTGNPSTQEVVAEGSHHQEVQGHPQLSGKLEASLSSKRPSQKMKKSNNVILLKQGKQYCPEPYLNGFRYPEIKKKKVKGEFLFIQFRILQPFIRPETLEHGITSMSLYSHDNKSFFLLVSEFWVFCKTRWNKFSLW